MYLTYGWFYLWIFYLVVIHSWYMHTLIIKWICLILIHWHEYIDIKILTLGLSDPWNSVRVGFADEICENMPYDWRNFEFGGLKFGKIYAFFLRVFSKSGGVGKFLCGEESWAALLEECGFLSGLFSADFPYIHFCSYSPSCGQGSGTKYPKTKARKAVAY